MKLTKEEMEKRLDEVLTRAIEKDQVQELKGFYDTGLYRYSFLNSLLIAVQGGTCCASYNTWKKAERHVRAGEHASIVIWRPMILNKKDPDTGENETAIFGFTTSCVFDISQTDGKPLAYKKNSKDVLDIPFDVVKERAEKVFKCKVTVKNIGNARGNCDIENGDINVNELNNNTDKIFTLIHEIAHWTLHNKKRGTELLKREVLEVEAETVSFLAHLALGADPEKSELYIKSWGQQKVNINKMQLIAHAGKIINKLFEVKSGLETA